MSDRSSTGFDLHEFREAAGLSTHPHGGLRVSGDGPCQPTQRETAANLNEGYDLGGVEETFAAAKKLGLMVPSNYEVNSRGNIDFKVNQMEVRYSWVLKQKKMYLLVDGVGFDVGKLKNFVTVVKKLGVK